MSHSKHVLDVPLMRVKSRLLLTAIWRASGQLRRQPKESPKEFGGVEIAPYKNGARSAACISADFELSWAWREFPAPECERRAEQERANVPFLLELLERFGIPITWSTVGHMFLESCRRGPGGKAHPEMPRPPRNDRWRGDWYLHDPCSDLRAARGWYAPDLIRMIQASRVAHEIGTHSFSHIDFSEHTSTAELVRHEIEACISAMEPFGVKPRSLVFCFNHMGYQHSDLLFELGIVAVRHRDLRFRLAYPERTPSGLYKLYESMNLRLSDKYAYVDKGRVFIDEAIKCGTAYHLWFHPSDDRRILQDAFAPLVQYLAAKQQRNEIWVTTMSDLASYREAREQMRIERQSDGRCDTLTIRCSLDKERFGDPEVTLAVTTQNGVRAITARGRALQDGAASLTFRSDSATGTTFFNIKSSVQKVEIQYSAHH
jgi:peptidoglycan/xylan/chitin deacetylase (PgdA/CDA1 family)